MKTTSELQGTVQDSNNRTETGQEKGRSQGKAKGRLPKTHADYWASRLRKRTFLAPDGKTEIEIPTWQVRLCHLGREKWFNLQTANRDAASIKARDIYQTLKGAGWEAALAKAYPDKAGATSKTKLTIRQFLDAVKGIGCLNPQTFLNYDNSLRTIATEAFGIRSDKSRFDHRGGGNKKWRERLDNIRLARLTPALVSRWQRRRLEAAGKSPVAISSAKRTCNSYVRCARSLFGKDILKRIKQIELPTPLPFDGIELYEQGSMKYISKIDVGALIAAAKSELKQTAPDAYKAFILALFGGLRRGEIDGLQWGMVDFQQGLLRLHETEYLHLKTDDSSGEVPLDPEVMAELRELKPDSKSKFVVSAIVTRTWGKGKLTRTWIRQPRNDSPRRYYRCAQVFERLTQWLRSKGISSDKPIHELRKELGAQIATTHGIFAASTILRHSDITTTARHYAQHRTRITAGLGRMLDTEIKPASADAVPLNI